MPRYKTKLALV